MRRFELIEGRSCKFWEVACDGSSYTVRYGRIGTQGQVLTKAAANEAKALSEVDRLIKEKTGKGYAEVAVAAGVKLAAVAIKPSNPAPSAAQIPPSTTEHPVTSKADVNLSVSAATVKAKPGGEASEPSGQFQLAPSWRKFLPAQRGYPLHCDPPPLDLLLTQRARMAEAGWRHSPWMIKDPDLEQLLRRYPFDQLLSEDSLRLADPDRWQAIILLGRAVHDQNHNSILGLLLELAVELHGPTFILAQYLTAMAKLPSRGVNWYSVNAVGVNELNAALALCSDEVYQQAKSALSSRAPATDAERFLRGAVFNTEPEWVAEALAVADFSTLYRLESAAGLAGALLSLDQAQTLAKAEALRGSAQSIVLALNLARRFGAAALPLVAKLYDQQSDLKLRSRLSDIICAFDSREAFGEMLSRIDDKEMRAQIDGFAQAWPLAAMQHAATHIAGSRSKPVEAWLARLMAAHPGLIEPSSAQLEAPAAAVLDRLGDKLVDFQEAPLEALPEVLRDPPWLKPQPTQKRPTLPELAPPPARMLWPEGLCEAWQQRLPANETADPNSTHYKARLGEALSALAVPQSLWTRIVSAEITDLRPFLDQIEAHRAQLQSYHRNRYLHSLVPLSGSSRLLLWNALPGWDAYTWEGSPTVGSLLAHYELQALPGLLSFIASRLEAGLTAALPVAAAEIAVFAAQGLNSKKARPHAAAWLRAHAELATTALLQPSARATKKSTEQADAALRWLAVNVAPERLQAGALQFGEVGLELLQSITAVNALSLLPQKLRALPSFYLPAAFSRPHLHNGLAVPASTLNALGSMLQVSQLDEPYAGLEQVTAACRADSLDCFAWDLFQAWYQGGASSKENWAFTAMGLIGGERCVRHLTPLIREWPGEAQHARAVTGLDILAGIGSDLALMNLNGIAQKAKFKGLQERAKEKIQAIAQARDLTAEELADRLVPDLDLDADGTLLLDFGPRQFTVGFDEHLRPYALDASGARLKDLPKPGKSDEGELAKAASERWKLLKKDVKSIASHQIQRLEQVMCTGRSFDFPVFEQFLVRHPLMRHLARRLLWGVVKPDGTVQAFRIAEDLSFADRDDALIEIPADATIGLPHPLKLSAEDQAAFGQIFADYEILQPFVQLGRETMELSPQELSESELRRFHGKRVAIGSVYGLQHRGWRHGEPQDGGWIGWFEKALPGGLEAQIELDPGTVVGDIQYESKQTLGKLFLRTANSSDGNGLRPLSQLDPVLRSELLRDLDRLAVLVD